MQQYLTQRSGLSVIWQVSSEQMLMKVYTENSWEREKMATLGYCFT